MTPTSEQENAALAHLSHLKKLACDGPVPVMSRDIAAIEILEATLLAARRDSERYRAISRHIVEGAGSPSVGRSGFGDCWYDAQRDDAFYLTVRTMDQLADKLIERDAAIAAAKGVA